MFGYYLNPFEATWQYMIELSMDERFEHSTRPKGRQILGSALKVSPRVPEGLDQPIEYSEQRCGLYQPHSHSADTHAAYTQTLGNPFPTDFAIYDVATVLGGV